MLVQLLTGFASGLPLLLTGSTLQAWMKDAQVDLGEIGLFALVGLPYTLKFIWAPAFDRYVPPLLGRRRGWIIIIQIAVALAIMGLGLSNPASSPLVVGMLALAVAFTGACQDIVLDAYRRESLAEAELGLGTSLFVAGYRLAMLCSGALALYLADRMPWHTVYALMAGLMVVGVVTTLFAPEPKVDGPPPRTLREAVVGPFLEFFRRDGWGWVIAFVLLYKLGDQLATSMTTPLILDLGFSKTELAGVAKVFGMGALIAGSFFGGLIMVRIGINRSLWVFGVLQGVGILLFAALAAGGKVWALLAIAVTAENLAMGMGSSAYLGYMASQTNRRFTATQYALLTSIMGVPRVLLASPMGFLAQAVGWTSFFVICTLIAIPGMLLLWRVAPWGKSALPKECEPEAAAV